MELVVTRNDEASLLAVDGMKDVKLLSTPTSMVWKVRWINVIVWEERIYLLLHPYLRPNDGGGYH